jgi:type I restriction enzyme S subunit
MNIDAKNLTKAIESKIDKNKWVRWKFSDLVENIVEKVVPKECGLADYIGLKHLDTGSLHIRRFGKCSEISGDKLRIYKGDLIFAKRNSYLKRVSIAKFDAVASAHSLVLRAKPENVLPEFLPFFLMSESFWNRAIEISVGSLSPTINWRVLAKQEFQLPPKDQQAELAELFWLMDKAIEKELALLDRLDSTKFATQRNSFDKKGLSKIEIGNCGKVFSGGTPNRNKEEYWNGTIPWVKTAEVNYGFISETEEKITETGLDKSAAKMIKSYSVLVAMYGQGVTRGRVAINRIPVCCNQACAVIEPNEDYEAEFIFNYLEFKYEELRSLAHGANQQNLNLKDLDKKIQKEINKELRTIRKSSSLIISQVNSSKCLQKSLINKVF